MTIAAENEKILRRSMLVACGVDETAEMPDVTPTTRYGSGTYDQNMRAGQRGITVKLMDLAGNGFPLDGTHYPIKDTAEADDGDATIVESYKSVVKYGIPASTASNSSGITSSIGFSVSSLPEGVSKLTAHLRDSEGKTYRVTSSSAAGLQSAVRAVSITPNARLYVDRISFGDSWQWDKSTLIECILNLRGVETKGDSPELQMSEIEIRGIVPDTDIESISKMAENSPIWYTAGYVDDVSPARRFYLSDYVTTENIVATVKGYDATKFLESEHAGVVSIDNNGFCFGNYMRCMARRCYGILGRGLIYDKSAEFAREAMNEVAGESSSDTEVRYMSVSNITRRTVIAAHCNLMHIAQGGLNNTGIYCDYVDAGLPTFRAGTAPIGETSFGHVWEIDSSVIYDFSEESEVPISKITARILYPKKETNDSGKTKNTSFYAEDLSKGDSRPIETEEPYTAVKFKEYDRDVRTSASGTRYIHSKIGNLYQSKGHYYPDKDTFGYSAFLYTIKATKTAKQRLIGIRNVATSPEKLSGLPSGASYSDGTLTYETGSRGEAIEFPDVFHGTLEQYTSSGSGKKSMWGLFLKQIADRSNIVYTFKYRGNPKMQPRDIIRLDIGGQTIEMTVDNLTLEHEAGGLMSTIMCRKGII